MKMAQQKFTGQASLVFADKMVALLGNERLTRAQIEAKLFASKSKIISYARFLNGRTGAAKRIYICAYDTTEVGGRVPVYAAGNRPDAKIPAPRTNSERYRSRKADHEAHQRYLARLRASAAAKRSRTKPVSIWAALGL